MGKLKRPLLGCVAVFVVGLVVMFPARVVHHFFSPPALQLAGIDGSVWRGSAREALVNGVYLRDLNWTVRPLSLFTGRVAFNLAAEPASGFIDARAAIGFGGTLYVDELNAAVPIAALQSALRVDDVSGDVSLQLTGIRVVDGFPQQLSGQAGVSNLLLRALSPEPVGNFRAEFQTSNGEIIGSIEDVSGMLDVAATLSLKPDCSYALLGRVGATATATSSVVQQLSFLGSPDARGLREFRLEGSL